MYRCGDSAVALVADVDKQASGDVGVLLVSEGHDRSGSLVLQSSEHSQFQQGEQARLEERQISQKTK